MNILIANVGNIRMNEIKCLAGALSKKKHTVTIACMAMESRYKGQAFSYSHEAVRTNHVIYQDGKTKASRIMAHEFYSTPADAVSVMLGEIMQAGRPDLVICGIDNGVSMGQDIYYSSNIGMAMEAAYFGIPVFAVGIENRVGGHRENEVAAAVKFIETNLKKLVKIKLPKSSFLSINIPTVENYSDLKGVKITRLGKLDLINEFVERTDHKGGKYYWAKNIERNGVNEPGTDIEAFSEGYVSVTPIDYNATSYEELAKYSNPLVPTQNKPMRIMLVNEEGCFNPGITALAKILSAHHRVNIVAPLEPLKGVGHSFTTAYAPLRFRQYFVLDKVKIFSVSGTPCDCVTFGLDKILKSKPDLIISGIDSSNNRGETIFSSGVVSAAVEGTIQGIPSIALSAKCETSKDEKDFLAVARVFDKFLPDFVKLIKPGITLNINFPANFSKRNIMFTHATDGLIDNKYTGEVNPFGEQFYWLDTPKMGFSNEALEQKGDLYWSKRNFITVTPIKVDLTCLRSLPILDKAGLTV